MAKKRAYSREFTPRTKARLSFTIDKVPATLHAKVKAKCKRTGTSLRALLLGVLASWVKQPEPPDEVSL